MVRLYLRADLFKASRVEKEHETGGEAKINVEHKTTPKPFRPIMKPKVREEEKEPEKAPEHKPNISLRERSRHMSGGPEGFKPGVIHAPGKESEDPGSVGKYPAGRAEGVPEAHMRVKPRGAKSTGAARTQEEMREVGRVTNAAPYKCQGKGCKATVIPQRVAKVKTEHELMSHLKDGGQWSGTHEGEHTIEHPPKLHYPAEDKKPEQTIAMKHGMVSSEHITSKLCPMCHAKKQSEKAPQQVARATGKTPEEATARAESVAAGEAKKSMSMLWDMMYMSKSLAEGEDFGKPAASVSEEIRHLIKEKGYPQKRAVAAALSMKRAGEFHDGKKAEKSLYLAL